MNYKELGRTIDGILRRNGGVTLRIIPMGKTTGLEIAEPTHGYQVGIAELFEDTYYDVESMDLEQIIARCHGGYIGFWLYKGKLFIDASMHIMDKESALRSAQERGEIAIFDWHTHEEVLVETS